MEQTLEQMILQNNYLLQENSNELARQGANIEHLKDNIKELSSSITGLIALKSDLENCEKETKTRLSDIEYSLENVEKRVSTLEQAPAKKALKREEYVKDSAWKTAVKYIGLGLIVLLLSGEWRNWLNV